MDNVEVRDLLAGFALCGILGHTEDCSDVTREVVSERAYQWADAMLLAKTGIAPADQNAE